MSSKIIAQIHACREGCRSQAIAKPLKRLWKEDRRKNNRVMIFAEFVDATLKFFTAILNAGFRRRIYLRSPNERKWKNVVWPIWSRNLVFAFGFEECFAKQNTWYVKLFPKALGRIARTSTPARSDCKASMVALPGIYFGNRDQQSCKMSPILIIDRTLTSGCQRTGISQSYFCVVRAAYNSNPWA